MLIAAVDTLQATRPIPPAATGTESDPTFLNPLAAPDQVQINTSSAARGSLAPGTRPIAPQATPVTGVLYTDVIAAGLGLNPLAVMAPVQRNSTSEARERIDRAAAMAESTLVGNLANVTINDDPQRRTVILAGRGKYSDLWTRDSMYTSMGALTIGQTEAVKGTLESLLSTQEADGLLPRRIHGGG